MKIVVPIKQILDPRGLAFRRDKERMFVNREEYVIGPGSKAALEAALRLRTSDETEVVALSLGAARVDDALREALAMGCDAAYLLSDEAFGEPDVGVTANILAAAIRNLGDADLVILGRASSDTGAAQMASRLAEALNFAQVTDVYQLIVSAGVLEATRRWTDGFATVTAPLPAVVSVAPQAFPARYPHGARIISAYREWDVITWGAADLDLSEPDLAPQLTFRASSFPPPLEMGEKFSGNPDDVAQDVITALRLQRLIG